MTAPLALSPLPAAARPLVGFASLLRANGFAVAPEQVVAFLAGVDLLGPRSIEDVRKAAVATIAPPRERRDTFDALFDAHFLGAAGEPEDADDWQADDDMKVEEEGVGQDILIGEEVHETGREATSAEALAVRQLRPPDDGDTLRRFTRALPEALPRRRGYRHRRARRGPGIDLAASLKAAIRNDGEVMALKRWRRSTRVRPILLLIDVSGSMKQRSDANLALAHALVHAAPRVEVFTFGTRLTRLTTALKRRNRSRALAIAADLVADWDGGTRIGDALQAFLAVPRFAGYARGAVVLILSDGLERGDPGAMIRSVQRLAARAHRIDWLSPLAADSGYRPETEGLAAIRPFITSLANGATTAAVCRHVLSLGRERAA
ncbi:vWA domain-containing protein [Phreatobacter sp.]|uniref:vWA domain-containing protein n=1 Tax=Phreatobacter sp. TaxID=1966341 RepID=UPI003F71D808